MVILMATFYRRFSHQHHDVSASIKTQAVCCVCMCVYVHVQCACVCVCIHRTAVISCMLFYTLLGTTPQSREQKHIPTSPNAAYEDINKFDTNINPAYGETTRQQHVTYEEISMQWSEVLQYCCVIIIIKNPQVKEWEYKTPTVCPCFYFLLLN